MNRFDYSFIWRARSSAIGLTLLAACLVLGWGASSALGSSLTGPSPGQLYAFGDNNVAQLGNETNVETQEPNPVPTPVTLPGQDGPVVQMAASGAHSLVVTEGGQLYAFGFNFHGQLGNETNIEGEGSHGWIATPTLVTLPGQDGPVVQAAAGNSSSLALTESGQLYAFGNNSFGQLGNETNINQPTGKANPTPTLVSLPGQSGPVVQAEAGLGHSLALTESGQLYTFGANTSGQLGRETTNPPGEWANPMPTLVTLPGQDGPVVQVAAGREFSLALTKSGQLYAFGANRFGQLGIHENSGPKPDPSENAHLTPTLVTLPGAVGPVIQVAAGSFHSLALTESGQLYAFGKNSFGQLGNTTNIGSGNEDANATPTPVMLPGKQGKVVEIAAGLDDSFALTSAGQLYGFGWNWFGELGRATNNKTLAPNPTPAVVPMPTGAAIETITRGQGASHMLVAIGLVLTTSSLPSGSEGDPYEAEVDAAGGKAPYHWSASGLPPGLLIDSASGQISGTPTQTACTGAPCQYTPTITVVDSTGMRVSRPLTIALAVENHALRVAVGGAGSGDVTSSPVGIDGCGASTGNCEAFYEDGTVITLASQPTAGSIFAGWSGGGCSGTGLCQITLSADAEITASFSKVTSPDIYTLAINLAGNGAGTVRTAAGEISCPPACSHPFTTGTRLTLTGDPASGSRFAGWSGGGCGSVGPCHLAIAADRTLTATFEKNPLARAHLRIGQVGSAPESSDCATASVLALLDLDCRKPKVAVGGTITKAARGDLTIQTSTHIHGRRVVASRRVKIHGGRWRASLPSPWAKHHPNVMIDVTVRFKGSPGVRGARATRRVKIEW